MRDWNAEPFVTGVELMLMPSYEAIWFLAQGNVWRRDLTRDVLVNCAHPDNREWLARDLLREASRQ